jgi:hypothetical protein
MCGQVSLNESPDGKPSVPRVPFPRANKSATRWAEADCSGNEDVVTEGVDTRLQYMRLCS